MYPFRDDNVYVKNAWYVGCLVDELAEGPCQRTIMDNPVVFFRSEEGQVRGMHGICPHRYYPLGLHGKVVGNTIQCNYHGYRFDGTTGVCAAIPSAPAMKSRYVQRVYPVAERGPYIWVWPGNPDMVDWQALPSLDAMRMGNGYAISPMMSPFLVKGRYMLGVENLMDLTHIGYLHSFTAAYNEIVEAPLEITETDEEFSVVRRMRTRWGLYHEATFKDENRFEGLADADSETVVLTPGYMMNTSQTLRQIDGIGKPDPNIFGEVWFHHILTPETKYSTHYFGTQTRSIRLDDDAFGEMMRTIDTRVRGEDVEAMEAIERQIQQFGEPDIELMTKSDAAAGRLRRRMQRMIDAEAAMGQVRNDEGESDWAEPMATAAEL